MAKARYKGLPGKAWEAVKKSVRRREKDCYTCERKDLIASGFKADTGHFKPVAIVGKYNKLSWHPKFIHLQCSRCNGPGEGMAIEYRAHLVKDYGEEIVIWFEQNYKKVNPVTNWLEVIQEWETVDN